MIDATRWQSPVLTLLLRTNLLSTERGIHFSGGSGVDLQTAELKENIFFVFVIRSRWGHCFFQERATTFIWHLFGSSMSLWPDLPRPGRGTETTFRQ